MRGLVNDVRLMDDARRLIDDVRRLIDDLRFRAYHRELRRQMKFNTFDVLRYSGYEIRHSNVLAWLLRPGESHGIGPAFVERFVGRVTSGLGSAARADLRALDFGAANVEVQREKDFVDVMIRFRKEKRLIVVENKIEPAHSGHLDQAMRYCREQQARNRDHTVTGVLLTHSPDGSVRIDDLTRDVARGHSFEPVVHVGWDFVLGEVKSLRRAGAFRISHVEAFIEQYESLLEGWFGPDEGFNELLEAHHAVLAELCRILEGGGEDRVRRAVPDDRTRYSRTLVRLVKVSRHDPRALRNAVLHDLRASGSPAKVFPRPLAGCWWLEWTKPSLDDAAQGVGLPRGSLYWQMAFSRHGVRVEFAFDSGTVEWQTLPDGLKSFMEKAPVNRREPDGYAFEYVPYGWEQIYRNDILAGEELIEMPADEAELELKRRLKHFMESDDAEYRRIDDYFQCLAFQFDGQQPLP